MLANCPLIWDHAKTTLPVGTGIPPSRVVVSSTMVGATETATISKRKIYAKPSVIGLRRQLPTFVPESNLNLISKQANLVNSSIPRVVIWKRMPAKVIRAPGAFTTADITEFAQSSCTTAKVEMRITSRTAKNAPTNARVNKVSEDPLSSKMIQLKPTPNFRCLLYACLCWSLRRYCRSLVL